MQDWLFSWTVDANGDGVPETERYSSTIYLPDLDEADGSRRVAVLPVNTLDGGVMAIALTRAGKYDHRSPGRFRLSWRPPGVPAGFAQIARQDYAMRRRVSVRLDHRWRACRVTSSGVADLKVTVAAGEVDFLTESGWLAAAYEHTCGASHTKVYATNSSGAAGIASGTSVPAGSVLLSNITIAASVVTGDPSGAANARTCEILDVRREPVGDTLDSLEIDLQEIR